MTSNGFVTGKRQSVYVRHVGTMREDFWKLNGNLKVVRVDAVRVGKISKAEESSGPGLGKYLSVFE